MHGMCDVKNHHQDSVSSDGIIVETVEIPLSYGKAICPCHGSEAQNKWISIVAVIGISQSTEP